MTPPSLRVPRASRLPAALVTVVLPLVLSLVAASSASAQTRAHAQLYVRVEGDDVKAAVQVRLDTGFHLFHGPGPKDMGSEGAAGIPTTIEFVGEGFTWSAPRFPEPEKEDQSFLGTGVYANVHFGTPTIWFRGKKTGDADASKLKAKIIGQTCDPMGCVPYSETVAFSGPGSDKLFARFPADLVVAAAAAPAAPSAEPAAAPANAQDGANAIDASRKHVHPTLYVREEGDELRAVLQLVIDAGYHIYHGPEKKDVGPGDSPLGLPTRVTMLGERVLWQPVVFPAPKRVEEPSLQTWYLEHDGTVVLTVRGKKAAGADVAKLSAKVEGQVCKTSCDQFSETVPNSGRGPDVLFAATADPARAPAATPDENDVANVPMWKFLLAAIGAALFSLVMPCTYPMIPITISFFTKQSAARQASSLSLSIVYGLGIVLSFIGIGVLVGPPIAVFAASPWTNLVIFVVFVVFGLSLLGLFLLQPPQFLMGFATTATQKGGYLGVFLMGMTLCVTSFTCTMPFVGSLLAVGAKAGTSRVVIGMGTFGLVMAVPFVFLSMLPAKAKQLPKSGEWVHSLKVTLGFIELAAAVKFLSNCDLVWKWNAFPREIVLALWSALLLAAAFYVWGTITLKEDVEIRGDATPGIGPKRLVIGLALFLLAMYLLVGAFGARLDNTTETLAPNYSKPLFTSGTGPGARRGGEKVASGPILDDWEAALAKAQAEHKLLAINFTGDV